MMLRRSVVSLFVFALAVVAKPAQAELQWSDNSFHLAYGTAYREPFDPENISKTILSFTHVDGYKWGSNFLNLDFLYSTSSQGDDVQVGGNGFVPTPAGTIATAGAMEVYAVYRHTLRLNKVTSSKSFEFGPVVRDVGIVAGIDLNTKNHAFSSRKIMPIGGVALAMNVPGFLNLEFLANKEWGVNGTFVRSTSFDVTATFAANWGIPLYGPVAFEGFADVNLPKGNGGAGLSDTVTEVPVTLGMNSKDGWVEIRTGLTAQNRSVGDARQLQGQRRNDRARTIRQQLGRLDTGWGRLRKSRRESGRWRRIRYVRPIPCFGSSG
jgi:hypothetical protein